MLQGQFNTTRAGRRYTYRFLPMMALYLVALFGANLVADTYHPDGAWLFVTALLPALPLVGVLGVMALYFVEEQDEYLRHRLALASLIATGCMLTVTTIWGFLEEAGQAPHLPAYWSLILWFMGLGFVQCVFSWRTFGAER